MDSCGGGGGRREEKKKWRRERGGSGEEGSSFNFIAPLAGIRICDGLPKSRRPWTRATFSPTTMSAGLISCPYHNDSLLQFRDAETRAQKRAEQHAKRRASGEGNDANSDISSDEESGAGRTIVCRQCRLDGLWWVGCEQYCIEQSLTWGCFAP